MHPSDIPPDALHARYRIMWLDVIRRALKDLGGRTETIDTDLEVLRVRKDARRFLFGGDELDFVCRLAGQPTVKVRRRAMEVMRRAEKAT